VHLRRNGFLGEDWFIFALGAPFIPTGYAHEDACVLYLGEPARYVKQKNANATPPSGGGHSSWVGSHESNLTGARRDNDE
jgi:hypothetical protein